MTIIRVLYKFRAILSRHQKIRILEIVALMVIAGFLEMLSVSFVLPFVEAITSPAAMMNNKYVIRICRIFDISDHRTFLIYLSITMAVIYVFKNLFLLFQITIQNKFVYNNMFRTQQDLLHIYLMRPYEYFLSIKSGEALRIIGSDTAKAFSILTQILSLISELAVSAALLVTVFFITPGITLAMGGILLVMTGMIQVVMRPLLKKAGEINQSAYANMNQWLLQSIQGIKEVKLMRKEGYFQYNFEKEGRRYVRTTYQHMTYSVVPRFMIEAIAMCAFFLIVAAAIYQGTDLASIIPVVSAIAMAAIRLLPSINRISGSMAGVAFGEPAVDKLLENLTTVHEYEDTHNIRSVGDGSHQIGNIKEEVMLDNIDYQYPTGFALVLKEASMEIRKGMSVGIVGPSGAGKTTVVDILLGLLRPQGGKVVVDGTDIELDMDGWLSNIGYIPQAIFMLDGSIRENVAFGVDAKDIDDDRVWDALKEAAIDDFVKSLPRGLDTQIGERGLRVSGGQRQRLGIARALYNNPSVLVFDEATSALDNDTELAIMESINNLHGSKTMVIIAHRLTTIEGCDIVYRVENGKIARER